MTFAASDSLKGAFRASGPGASGAVGKHTASIFGKLGLGPSDDTNRRGLAVIRFLDSAN
ncbi:hypothetical protein [Amycolatopsis minnesotensis]|uniref:Uncharacterized protein n=1 Tax=Amycolatopsis minnesotensis TaxID=337894 RepID=A0ABP5CP13_9PSEU